MDNIRYEDIERNLSAENAIEKDKYMEISIDKLEPGQNIRLITNEDVDKDFADNIEKSGVINPITVVKDGSKYRITAGHRRYKAALEKGLKTVPVIVKDLTNREQFVIGVSENIQREQLTPEEQLGICEIALEKGYCTTQIELAKLLNVSLEHIKRLMKLRNLDKSILMEAKDVGVKTLAKIASIGTPGLQRHLLKQASGETIQNKIDNIVLSKGSKPRRPNHTVEITEGLPKNVKVTVKQRGYRFEVNVSNHTITALAKTLKEVDYAELGKKIQESLEQLGIKSE